MKCHLKGLTFAVVVAFAGLAFSSSSLAERPVGGTDVENFYYRDAAHTVLVGYRHYPCNRPAITWGQTTSYSSANTTDCSEADPGSGFTPPDPIYTQCIHDNSGNYICQ